MGGRYAATIVVLAAGLSGVAQAVYLAGGIDTRAVAPVGLRFGVGAWPAAAAALTAHLLHLIGTTPASAETPAALPATCQSTPRATALNPAAVQPYDRPYNEPSVQPSNPGTEHPAVQPARTTTPASETVQPDRSTDAEPTPNADTNDGQSGPGGGSAPARDRAQYAARSHYTRHGALPTVTELMALAQVARGTAGTVLKDLRHSRPPLHLVNANTPQDTDA